MVTTKKAADSSTDRSPPALTEIELWRWQLIAELAGAGYQPERSCPNEEQQQLATARESACKLCRAAATGSAELLNKPAL